jgi:hypothetical protein
MSGIHYKLQVQLKAHVSLYKLSQLSTLLIKYEHLLFSGMRREVIWYIYRTYHGKVDEMGMPRNAHGAKEMRRELLWERQKGRGHYEDLDIGYRIMLK